MARTAGRKAGSFGAELGKTLLSAAVIALFIRTFFFEPFSIPSASMVPTLLVGDYLFVSKFSYGYSRFSLPYGYLLPSVGRIFFRAPHRGDVVVFKLPCDFSRLAETNPGEAAYLNQSCDPSTDFIKRIVGLPGDKVQMRKGTLYINDVAVPEQKEPEDYYYPECSRAGFYPEFTEDLPGGARPHHIIVHCRPPQLDDTPVFDIPPGHYFMMGDNRDDSADSRDPTSGVGYVPAENLVGPAQFIFFSTSASLFEPWTWPFGIRFSRLFRGIH
jgi:signal peptidase I